MMRSATNVLATCFVFAISTLPAQVMSHQAHKHAPASPTVSAKSTTLEEINAAYIKSVRPIFQVSCFDCHASATKYQWYSKLPGAKHLITYDVTEAKVHLDLSGDFPFKGHGSPIEDLKAIAESVEKGTMPPFRYRILHPVSKLSDKQATIIREWVQGALTKLESDTSSSP